MMMAIDIPSLEDSNLLADWLEVRLFLGRGFITKTELRRILANSSAADSDDIDIAISFLLSEIKSRRIITADAYPFRIDGLKILLDSAINSEFYKFLLLVEFTNSTLDVARRNEASEIFDDIALGALKNYFGNDTNVLRFAWPPIDDRPSGFEDALDWLSTCTGLPRGVGQNSVDMKDGGVDIVAWKPFQDDRTGFLFALAQCTVQKLWLPKAKDIIGEVWLKRIDSGRQALTILMIPFAIPKDFQRWDELTTILNLVFERYRMTYFLRQANLSSYPRMIAWSRRELANL